MAHPPLDEHESQARPRPSRRAFFGAFGATCALAALAACDKGSGGGTTVVGSAESKKAPLLPPGELNARLADVKAGKIAVFQIGPQILWKRERVPGSVWVGEAGKSEGLAALEAAVGKLGPDVEVVAYCGCCPTEDCPNVRPARRVLSSRAKASVLDLPTNFRTDWVDKGYSVEKG